ncbi:MAG: response regulator transcription factor [Flavobacteriales bacterium]|nr:response regulator transcription factor [Flavobacteriales bacterium]
MKILIVEDDKIMSNVLDALLKPEGYEILVARDGIDALKMIIDTQPSLIITDIMMPNLSGLELLNIYKGQLFQETPVIVISSMDAYDVQYFAIAVGAAAYFVKPFSGAAIVQTVNDLLAKAVKQ